MNQSIPVQSGAGAVFNRLRTFFSKPHNVILLILGIILTVIGAVFLAGSLVFLIFFDKKTNRKGGAPRAGVFFLAAAVGLIICAVQWASMLLLGFM